MTPLDLQAWRNKHNLTNQEAAVALCLSLRTFLNLIYGQAPITDRVAKMTKIVEQQQGKAQ